MLFEFAVKVIKIKQQERLGGEVHSTEAGLLNKSSNLAAPLGVANVMATSLFWLNLTKVCRGQFVEQKLMLSSNFGCYQIHNCQRYDFGHTLLCYLSRT